MLLEDLSHVGLPFTTILQSSIEWGHSTELSTLAMYNLPYIFANLV
jgi:hypothetical protein